MPLPDGPVIASDCAGGDEQVERVKDGQRCGPARHGPGDAAQVDHDVIVEAASSGFSSGQTLSATIGAPFGRRMNAVGLVQRRDARPRC